MDKESADILALEDCLWQGGARGRPSLCKESPGGGAGFSQLNPAGGEEGAGLAAAGPALLRVLHLKCLKEVRESHHRIRCDSSVIDFRFKFDERS